MNGTYLNDLKSSTNSIKLMVLSDIMRFWKPLKQPFPRPCHDLLLQALKKKTKQKERKLNRSSEGRFQTSNHHSCSFHIEPRCTPTVPWQFPKGWERTAAGTGWTRPCWKKRTKRRNRLPVPGFYWKRGKMVQESHPL